jgi:hypothetical protein
MQLSEAMRRLEAAGEAVPYIEKVLAYRAERRRA